jgi:hypothetical protein
VPAFVIEMRRLTKIYGALRTAALSEQLATIIAVAPLKVIPGIETKLQADVRKNPGVT